MAQEQLRRPQDQAAWLVTRQLEAWASERDLPQGDLVEPVDEEVEAWVEESTTP